ncbi:MAG: FG-GAP-like repeat-containing protein, partial [Limisphaerales bacterium]
MSNKTKLIILMAGIFLLSLSKGMCQPIIADQPQSQSDVAGANATFVVTATGTSPLDYQWHFGAANLPLSGETNATLVLTNVQTAIAGNYTVVITNSQGAVTSAVATLTVLVPPSITKQPSSHNVLVGQSATLGVIATGTQPLAYQWTFNAQPVAGATRSSLVFTSVQFSNAGVYTVTITNLAGSIPSEAAMLEVMPSTLFTRITNGPIATDLGQSGSCVWADFNNDGFLDLYVAQYFSQTNCFYRNNGDGSFTRITQGDALVTSGYNFGVSAADYDNDGYLDFIVATAGSSPIPRRCVLFHNNGDFTFSRVSAGGVTNQLGWFPSAQWADYDNDGFVDLLISQSDSTESGAKTNLLWHNNADGSFARVAGSPLVADRMAGWGLLWSDYDNDGRIDVLVLTSDNGHNYLYHNNASGAFARVLD